MSRRPIQADIDAGRGDDAGDPGVAADRFREALAHWAATVTVVAVRDEADVHAVTVTSFAPVSAEPPQIVVSLGPNANVVPFLKEGRSFVVNLLDADQRRLATTFADAFPVGPSPFPDEGEPVLGEAVVSLLCTVRSIAPVDGGARLVTGVVDKVLDGRGEEPLLYYRRGYVRPDAR